MNLKIKKSDIPLRKGLLCSSLFLLGLWLGGEYGESKLGQLPMPLRGDAVDVRFSPKGGSTEWLVSYIDQAEHSIYSYIFAFTSKDIADALLRAAERGVAIYLIVDRSQSYGKYSQLPRLYGHTAALYRDKRKGCAHHKWMVIDRKKVLTGSFNYSRNAEEYNRENLLCIALPALAIWYIKDWEAQRRAIA